MKPVSARASYNDLVVQKLFAPTRAKETSAKILTARANATDHIFIAGLNVRTSRDASSRALDKKKR